MSPVASHPPYPVPLQILLASEQTSIRPFLWPCSCWCELWLRAWDFKYLQQLCWWRKGPVVVCNREWGRVAGREVGKELGGSNTGRKLEWKAAYKVVCPTPSERLPVPRASYPQSRKQRGRIPPSFPGYGEGFFSLQAFMKSLKWCVWRTDYSETKVLSFLGN